MEGYASPLKAVRLYCLECCLGSSKEVDLCGAVNCPLYGVRSGHGRGPTLKIIREKCLDCCAGSSYEVMKCEEENCSLWAFRSGHNPRLKGKRVNNHPFTARNAG